jgi:homoserine O-acetyltransferase
VRVERLRIFDAGDPLRLDCGAVLPEVVVAYEAVGALDAEGANAVLVCHALTGSAHVCGHAPVPCNLEPAQEGWWEGLVGAGKALDPRRYFVVCTNILGSCYGTTGPASIDPRTGRPYGPDFPPITVRDMVRVQHRLLVKLGVKRLVTVIGGSLGGMQVLEWALLYPEMVASIVPIATAAHHSPWAIALNEVSRLAILSDPAWRQGRYGDQPGRGLALARMIAIVSYRCKQDFDRKFERLPVDGGRVFADFFGDADAAFGIAQYLRYQGTKLVNRFDANCYLTITRAMDAHDVGRGRGTMPEALGRIAAPALCVGIDSDVLYPVEEQKEIAAAIPRATYAEIRSQCGHDGFLVEHEQLGALLGELLAEVEAARRPPPLRRPDESSFRGGLASI